MTRRELQDEAIRRMLDRALRCGTYLLGRIRCAYSRSLCFRHRWTDTTYDRHRYDAEARVRLEKWADYLETLTADKVVSLRAA